jgi:hypothetical protein
MSNPIYKSINITNLLLNPNNPRFDPVEHQVDAINSMILDQQDKLIVLAKHIISHGLNPTDLILVKPHNKQWIVCEGNRRVTALKLLNEPSLISPEHTRLRKGFQHLSKTVEKGLFESIRCVILQNEDEINEWVRLKHTGQNEGSGTVGWDGQQTSRFRAIVERKPDMKLEFLDRLRNMDDLPQDLKEKLGDIKKTNFDRLMGDPDFRKMLGIDTVDNTFILKDGINHFLIMVLSDLVHEVISVGTIYHKKDRLKYMESLRQRITQETPVHLGEHMQKAERTAGNEHPESNWSRHISDSTFENDSDDEDTKDEGRQPGSQYSSKRAASYPSKRKALIPPIHKLTITHARILKIFNELKSIPVDNYPNAVAVLFRVFIELSMDCFISRNSVADSKINVDSKLSAKINAVADYFEANKILTKNELRAIRQMTASKNQTQSIKTFHSYVHNKDVTPSSYDLKSAWDDIWPFIEKVWE